jgi:hypothetical protein
LVFPGYCGVKTPLDFLGRINYQQYKSNHQAGLLQAQKRPII